MRIISLVRSFGRLVSRRPATHNLFPYRNPNRICFEFNPLFDINPVITWSGRNYRWGTHNSTSTHTYFYDYYSVYVFHGLLIEYV